MAVQVSGGVKPVIVKLASSASEAEVSVLVTVPLPPQLMLIVTLAALLSEKSLLTLSVALFSVFVIVQVPTLRAAAQVAGEE